MGYEKITTYAATLFPGKDTWLFVLAGAGVLLSLLRRNRVGTFLGIMAVLAGVVFRVAPQARLWNARVLPFWFLCLYLLVGVAFMEAGLLIIESLRGQTDRRVLWRSRRDGAGRSDLGELPAPQPALRPYHGVG